jgi:hypothetical protein
VKTRPATRSLVAGAALAFLAACSGSGGSSAVPLSSNGIVTPNDGDFLGCPYPFGDVYQTIIGTTPLNPNSSAYISAMLAAGGGGGFVTNAPTTDELINAANNQTPMVAVPGKVKWHTPVTPIPWQSNFYIEKLSDHHALVLQAQDCKYYEGYDTTYSNGALAQYSSEGITLFAPFVRPATGGLSTASGIPFGLLAVRPEELSAGVIKHALGWDAVAQTLSQTACVSPAGVTNCTDDLPYNGPASETPMPYGAHARLKASFNISNFHTESKIVALAMQQYGMYVYDTGCCNTIVFVNDQYGQPTWTSADASDLQTITPSDLEIVVAP